MAINHEFESLKDELEQIFKTCPLSQDNKANINDLFDQFSVKFDENTVGLLKEEIGLSSNVVEGSVSFDDFVKLISGFILRYTKDNNLDVEYYSSELTENGNSLNEEFSNHNDELDRSERTEYIKYLRDSKKWISKKLLKAESAIETLENCVENHYKNNIQLNKQIERMREDVKKLQFAENENKELREKVIQFDIESKHSNDDLKKVSSQIEILEEENDFLTGKINKLKQDLDKTTTLLTQNEKQCQVLCEEISLLKKQHFYLAKDAEKATIDSNINESLLQRIDDLLANKYELQFQISKYELSTMDNFDHLNESSVNERTMNMTCPQNNSGVSLRSELSGIYDPEMEVFKKKERIALGKSISTQTDFTNSVCTQTDIVLGPEPSSERALGKSVSTQTDFTNSVCTQTDIVLGPEPSSERQSSFEDDQKVKPPSMEIMCAINPPSTFIGKIFNFNSLMIVFILILAYFSLAILVKWKRICNIYGNDIRKCLIENLEFNIRYPNGRTM